MGLPRSVPDGCRSVCTSRSPLVWRFRGYPSQRLTALAPSTSPIWMGCRNLDGLPAIRNPLEERGARTSYPGDLASPAAGEALERWPARAQPWHRPASAYAIEASPGCLGDGPLIVDYGAAMAD